MFFCRTLLAALSLAAPLVAALPERAAQVLAERQPQPDLGNGQFRNPVLAGSYGDPSVVRVGPDYYMTHSGGGGGGPTLLIWHSRDLVNWRPLAKALPGGLGDPWAPDLIYHGGRFYIYVTLVDRERSVNEAFKNVVLHADRPEGPWSEPVDLNAYGNIDPGHVVDENGNRFIYFDKGLMAPLTPDGLKLTAAPTKVYAGWNYPADWVVECFCLESPKLLKRGDWYYLVSAQGGTNGPSTSHMIVTARSRSPIGPWENSPYNPMLRTIDRAQRWHSQGHGTLIDDIAGRWWVVFHGYENGHRAIGRQTLLQPVIWTADGWPRLDGDRDTADIFQKPSGENVGHGMALSDDFTSETIGLQWYVFGRGDTAPSAKSGGGVLRMPASGDAPRNASLLSLRPVNHSYEATVIAEIPATAQAGLLLYQAARGSTYGGVSLNAKNIEQHWKDRAYPVAPAPASVAGDASATRRIHLKVRSDHHDTAYFYSLDGKMWKQCDRGDRLDGTNIRIALFAMGSGEVKFSEFRYLGLD